ncbi:MAG: hypothetical protein J5919_03800, partial [Clostridia bacterium]|nr:hypothetical protein [Clostridia bacterium]
RLLRQASAAVRAGAAPAGRSGIRLRPKDLIYKNRHGFAWFYHLEVEISILIIPQKTQKINDF